MNIKNKINNMDDAKREKLGEVIRFGIVGGLATVLQYVIYLAMMPALAHFIPNMGDHSLATTANTIAYIVSFIFNFIASTRYTFKVKANAKRGAGFTLSHIVNYSMQTLCLNLFVGLGLAKQLAMIPTLCICIPVNFCSMPIVYVTTCPTPGYRASSFAVSESYAQASSFMVSSSPSRM